MSATIPPSLPSDPMVALYASARAAQPCAHLTLSEFYRRIRSGVWAQPVAHVRRCRAALDATSDPAERIVAERAWHESKAQLPAVTLSCDGHTRERAVALAERGLVASGRVQIDLDLHGESATERERLRSMVMASPHIEALWLSPSGDGLKATVLIAGAGDPDHHHHAFAAVDRWLTATIGRANDPSVKDPQRLCFVSHDAQLFLNQQAVPLERNVESPVATAPALVDALAAPASITSPPDMISAASAASAASPTPTDAGTIIRSGNRNAALARHAGWMRRSGMSEAEITAGLLAINVQRCQPPLEASEVHRIAASIARYEPDQVTMATIENWAASTLTGERRLAVERIDQTQEQRPDWLWPGYLLRGATTVVGGRQGSSKGLFTLDLAARLTRGDVMPDGSGGGAPCNVLIVAREDDAAMALCPRLRVAGADLARVFWSYGDFTDGTPIPTMAVAATHIADAVRTHDIGLVIIDPLGAWVEEDANNGQQIRAVIDPLNRVVRETGCAVIFVAHLRKALADDPMDAFAGSVQVTAACRTAILISPSPDGAERLVRVVKTNFRRSEGALFYRLHSVSDNPDEPPVLVWRLANAEDLAGLAARPGSSPILRVASVLTHLRDEHRPLKEAARAIRQTLLPQHRGLSVQAVADALLAAVAQGLAHAGEGRRGVRTIGLQPAPVAETVTDRAVAYWDAHPESSVREVARAVACGVGTASRARSMAVLPAPSSLSHDAQTEQATHGTMDDGASSRDVPPIAALPLRGRSMMDGTNTGRMQEKTEQHSHGTMTAEQEVAHG